MKLTIRKWLTFIEHKLEDAGQQADVPLRKLSIVAIARNPFLGGYHADLSEGIAASEELGIMFGQRLVEQCGDYEIQSYGKAGIVGMGGEQEHANALLSSLFADPIRAVIGGGKSWIPSVTKVAAPGTLIDVPLAAKDALYVRSHYDAMTLCIPDGPMADEVALIFTIANRGRINARVGGLKFEELKGVDGLV
ncbi:MAG TPA: amino acid synthesis family protein [Herbaspirillum sp.]|jgi:hypothetical protein